MSKPRLLLLFGLVMSLLLLPAQAVLAQEYNCGAYGAGGFGDGDCIAASGDLSDTGINVWLLRAIAALLLLLAVGVFVYALRKRRQRHKSTYRHDKQQ